MSRYSGKIRLGAPLARRAFVLCLLATALTVCALYLPHAFGQIGFDPAPTLEKILEMVLYIAVGVVCGLLVDREGRARGHGHVQRSLDAHFGFRRAAETQERNAKLSIWEVVPEMHAIAMRAANVLASQLQGVTEVFRRGFGRVDFQEPFSA